jgi:hypothetical protein
LISIYKIRLSGILTSFWVKTCDTVKSF